MRAFALLLLFSADQPVSDPPKVEQTVVVTATRSERAVSEVPLSTTVLSEDEIRNAPATSIDELLRTVPGVHMAIGSSSSAITTSQRVSMHGLGGVRTLVLLDGIPIHDPYYGTVQWQKVPLDSLRQVEVVRGGNASLFGNFALGGTINLITRPVDTSGVRADLALGNADTRRGSATVDQVLSPKWSLRVSANHFQSGGFFRVPEPGPIDIGAGADMWNTSARADYRPTDRTSGFLRTNLAKIDVSQGTVPSYDNRDIFDTSAGVHHGFGSSALLSASAFYQRQRGRTISTTVSAARTSEFVSQDTDLPATSGGASVEWSLQRRGVIPFVSFGVDVQQMATTETRLTFNRQGETTLHAKVQGRQKFGGVYGQASWQPNERLEVLASVRVDYFRNEDGSQTVVGGSTTRYPETTSTQLDPRLSLRYALGNRTAVRGSAYRAFKAPTLRDLYRDNQTGTSILLGNPYLEPETLVGGEVGVEWATDRSHVQVNLFRSDIEGLLSRTQVPGQPSNVFQNVNLGTGRSQGVETIVDVRFSNRWSVNAGYTYADARVVEDPNPALEDKLFPEVAPHIGTLSVRYRGNDGLTADLRGRVLSRSYGEAANLRASPAHRILDISVSRPITSWLDAYAVVENLLDEDYYYVLTPTALRSGQPRVVTGGVRIQFATGRNP